MWKNVSQANAAGAVAPFAAPQKRDFMEGFHYRNDIGSTMAPDFFKAYGQTIQETDLATIQAYLRVHLADSYSMRLPEAFDNEHFDFYGRKLEGVPQERARWKRCVQATDSAMGEALGKIYVEQYFTPNMKAETVQVVYDIETAMGKDIDAIDWMSPETRVKA